MSAAITLLAALVLLAGCASGPSDLREADLTVASFNIHYLSLRRDVLPWDERRDAVQAVLAELDADLIAFQEMETFGGGHSSDRNIQLDFVLDAFPRYRAAAVGDPDIYPSTQPVLYDPDVLTPVEQGFFFFSPTPDLIYSRPWRGRYPAFASWVRFRHNTTDKQFHLFNVHFDASTPSDRLRSADLTIDRVADIAGEDAVIVLGDFNAPLLFPTMRRFIRAGFRHSGFRRSTFHFNRGLRLFPAIDHILVRGPVDSAHGEIIRSRYQGVFPSDHYPIRTEIDLTSGE
jgi:endonuclease/exonuclease/phosphatase family metal-dependent hydrolase